jgi:PHP family Zn ribbon phosphoesterase
MKEFYADLHIHSCLSPCADITMLPVTIAKRLVKNNIKIASITDHNSLLNIKSFHKVFERLGIFLVPGIEIQTVEEAHILGYFDSINIAKAVQKEIEDHVSPIKNNEDLMGYQLIVNDKSEYIQKYDKALSLSTNLTLEEAAQIIKKFNGICVAAHIDKTFGVIKQLGFIPDGIFDAVEVFNPKNKITGYTNLSSSDAHYLYDIKKPKMKFTIKNISFEEIKLAIKEMLGRKITLN